MADLGNNSVFAQADASNASGTMPSWSGSAAPSTLDDAGRALQGAVTREWNWRNFTITAGGSADVKTLTYSTAPAAYYNGQQFAFIANTTNTGSATLNVNSLGAKTIKKDLSGTLTNLSASDMVSGMFVEVAYNTANDCFVWVNRGAIPTLGALASLNTVGTSQIDALAVTTAKIAANAVDGTKIALGSDAQGDIMYYDGTDWARLAAGTSGQYLKTNGAGANPAWATLSSDSFTLLGTITTTSGASQSLSSLVLSPYKQIYMIFKAISNTNGTTFIINSASPAISSVASGDTFSGYAVCDLYSGVGRVTGRESSGSLQDNARYFAITTATTTITISVSPGTLDAGSVEIYGVV